MSDMSMLDVCKSICMYSDQYFFLPFWRMLSQWKSIAEYERVCELFQNKVNWKHRNTHHHRRSCKCCECCSQNTRAHV